MSKSARSQFTRSCKRRGNALILVAGVLVLLVIIATVFLSRTRTLRELGTAQRQGAFHRDRMESSASEIAQELADSLFVRTIDFTEAEYGLWRCHQKKHVARRRMYRQPATALTQTSRGTAPPGRSCRGRIRRTG